MTPKEFKKLLERDQVCQHCGVSDDTLIPQHRINRGMGGSKLLDRPSNLVLLCSNYNGLIESNSGQAEFARKMGLKLSKWENTTEVPIFFAGQWYLLDDKWGRYLLPYYNPH
jgi:5-methylcytosine-specific restriction endonuclease McrA